MTKHIANTYGNSTSNGDPGVYNLFTQEYFKRSVTWPGNYDFDYVSTYNLSDQVVFNDTSHANGISAAPLASYNNKAHFLIAWTKNFGTFPSYPAHTSNNQGAAYAAYAVVSVNNVGTIQTVITPTIFDTVSGYEINLLKDIDLDSVIGTGVTSWGGAAYSSWGANNGYRGAGQAFYSNYAKFSFSSSYTNNTIGVTDTAAFFTSSSVGFCDAGCIYQMGINNSYMIAAITGVSSTSPNFVACYGTSASPARNYFLTGDSSSFTGTLYTPASNNLATTSSLEYNPSSNNILHANSTLYFLSSDGQTLTSSTAAGLGTIPTKGTAVKYIGSNRYIHCNSAGGYNIISSTGSAVGLTSGSYSATTSGFTKVDIATSVTNDTDADVAIVYGTDGNFLKGTFMRITGGSSVTIVKQDLDIYTLAGYSGTCYYPSVAMTSGETSAIVCGYDAAAQVIRVSSIMK